ncbi:organic cation transporter protein-like [Glandiceps talaboti]
MVEFDDILKHVGEFGTYQKRAYHLLCLVGIIAAFHAFAQVFLVAETDHWCNVPELDGYEETYCVNTTTKATCLETMKNLSIPREENSGNCESSFLYSNCHRYDVSNISFYPGMDITKYTNNTIGCDYGWKYDRTQYKSTIFQEYDLVCGRYYLGALSSSMQMVGLLIGNLLFGMLSDKIGRMKALIIATVLMIVSGTACAFSPNIIVYCICRIGVGCAEMGMFLAAYVLGTELVGPSKRLYAGIVIDFFFSFGYILMSGLAYFIRYWWILQLVMTLPSVLFLSYWWIIPESPRWLMSVGKTEKAEQIIRKCAKVNKRTVPESVYEELQKDNLKNEEMKKTKEDTGSVTDIFRLPNMRKKTLSLFCIWATNSMVYYGLALNTSRLGGDDYLNAFISGAVEFPAQLLSLYAPGTILGRRWSLCSLLVAGGTACLLTLFAPSCEMEWIGISLAMTGKLCITASYSVVYLFTVEMYPTPLRTIGIGLCSTFARFGGILAPQMLLIGSIWEPLPIIIFGVCSILAGSLALWLPETRNRKLPETMQEGENFGKKSVSRKCDVAVDIMHTVIEGRNENGTGMKMDLLEKTSYLDKAVQTIYNEDGVENPVSSRL